MIRNYFLLFSIEARCFSIFISISKIRLDWERLIANITIKAPNIAYWEFNIEFSDFEVAIKYIIMNKKIPQHRL